ncbi:MAG: hypothetical protein O3C67_03070 [Cyanobacteria bacterium]|nr:hypothetical protein [Cyanobacteriota bacterium]
MNISFSISTGEWEAAQQAVLTHSPGSDYDNSLTPLYDLLYGSLQLSEGDSYLFPSNEEGLTYAILDFACALARSLLSQGELTLKSGEAAQFILLEQRATFTFTRNQEIIEITCDRGKSTPLSVPFDEFRTAVMQFIKSFLDNVKAKAPGLLEWESTLPLKHAEPSSF